MTANPSPPSKLDQLREYSVVVADTGDIDAIRRYQPVDATTNPSLLLKAAQLPQYQRHLHAAIAHAATDSSAPLAAACDHLAVSIGIEILQLIPGRISTEVDARLSFDTAATIARAERLVERYESAGIGRERILIKMASTWEGIRAAEQLERSGINCNLTLLFSFVQAAAAAAAGAYLISPFVGRILDWHQAHGEPRDYRGVDDPGVQSVVEIYNYYKANGYATVVMGASFRNTSEIEALAGCDRLTINPTLLAELAADCAPLSRQLRPEAHSGSHSRRSPLESDFRYQLNANAMATEKLAEGIRWFVRDQQQLEQLLQAVAKTPA